MKHPALPANRRPATAGLHHHPSSAVDSSGGGPVSAAAPSSSPSAALFWRVFHPVCCLISALLGFRCSRFLFFLLFASSPSTQLYRHDSAVDVHSRSPPPPPPPPLRPPPPSLRTASSHVVVGRHGILVRPGAHPDPGEMTRAHRILARVQQEQRLRYGGVKSPRPLLVVTPTYSRTFQALHLTGLMHSLMLSPYPLTWIVVDASPTGGLNDTAALLAGSNLPVLHLPFREPMPARWDDRHRLEARMRLYALRVIRERRLDGIVMFADDSNMHSMELFDEVQKVKWMGAVSVGILPHSWNPTRMRRRGEEEEENSPMPIQGPACNSSGHLIGWHTFNSLPYLNSSATFVGDAATVLPRKLEWAGYVMNSRLVWKQAEEKPDWVRDLDEVGMNGEEIDSPLDLLKAASFVEPLGNCGKKVLLWWLRVEARYDSKFPSGWVIDPPLDITVASKHTPWSEMPQFPSERIMTDQESLKHPLKPERPPRSRRSSRSKRKREVHVDSHISRLSQREAA